MKRIPVLRPALVAALAAAVAIGACAPGPDGPPRPQPGVPAPPYVATTLEGDTVSLESLRGKVVLLNLWATWCAPCRHETPFLQEQYERYAEEGFEIVGISMDVGDAADDIAMFVEEYGVTYTILHDPEMKGMESYQVLGLPATFLIDREGNLQWMRYGPVGETDEDFFAAVEDALR